MGLNNPMGNFKFGRGFDRNDPIKKRSDPIPGLLCRSAPLYFKERILKEKWASTENNRGIGQEQRLIRFLKLF